MEKLLIDEYANIVLYDTENNALKQLPESIDLSSTFVADEDGQAISKTEVVDYKKGDLIIILRSYDKDSNWATKIVRCEDVFAKDDLLTWYNSLKKKDEAV